MWALYTVLIVALNVLGAGFVFHYVARATGQQDNPFLYPEPFLSALFWPLSIIYIMLRPLCKLGTTLCEYQINRQQKKEAKATKIRIELLKAQEELEGIERELEHELKEKRAS